MGVECDPGEDRLVFNLCAGLFSLYLIFDLPAVIIKRLPSRPNSIAPEMPVHYPREISLSFYDGGPWWCLWMDPDEWHSEDPFWRRGHVDFRNVLLGRMDYKRIETGPAEVASVWMPEGAYSARFTPYEATRTRRRWPRWPLRSIERGWDVRIEGGIPTETDDGIWGLGVEGGSLCEAASAVRVRVLESRRRDSGSSEWRPRETVQRVP